MNARLNKASALSKKHHVNFVDVAITGAVNLHGAKTPLLCAGEKAEDVAQIFKRLGTPIQVVGDKPGDAAALKLLRSIFTKGLEALSVECLLTAEKRGLRFARPDQKRILYIFSIFKSSQL